MMFIPILLFGLVIYLMFKDSINIPGFRNNDSNDILDIRLAKGEISIEEYREIKNAKEEK